MLTLAESEAALDLAATLSLLLHAALTPTLAESPVALDHAATQLILPTPLDVAVLEALAELPLAPSATLLTVLTDIPAESPHAVALGVVTPSVPFPLPFLAAPDTALDATLVRMTSALTTLSQHSPFVPLLPTLYPLPPRRDLCLSEELAATT